MRIGQLASALTTAALLGHIFAGSAHAYLDPGSGSYILQILMAFFLAGGFAVKLYFSKIKAFFTDRIGRKK